MKSYYFLLLTILTALLPFSSLKCENQLQILSVNTEDYPEAIFVEFTVKGDKNNFVKDLGPDDFAFYDNGTRKFGCLQMMEDLSSIKQSYDIIFLVDNSGSMKTPQEKLNQTIPNLVESLSEKGNVRVVADGDYKISRLRADERRGPFNSDLVIESRNVKIPARGGVNPAFPSRTPGYLTGVFIHRSNNDGRAGTYNKDGKTKGISEGCLLILPNQWNKFVKQLSSANNMKLRLIR